MNTFFRISIAAALLATGYAAGRIAPESVAQAAQDKDKDARVFEMRTYVANDGKLPALEKRFRDHTIKFFNKYSMTSIGYWKPMDGPAAQTTLVYILAHPSREAAAKNWQAFHDDPEWQKVKAASEAQGPLTTKMESVFADPTDYSPMK